MTAALQELGEYLSLKRNDCVLSWSIAHDELTVDVAPSNIKDFVEFLKSDQSCKFSTLVDITGVDYPERAKRFDVVYHFLSMYQNHRIRLRVSIREEDMLPSIVNVHPSANWFEREVFDMFGILFTNHPDLRRLLTDYGFRGYPLRKDFPLEGKPTEVPDVASTDIAPLEGGPFVTLPSSEDSTKREPRRRNPEDWQN